MSLPSHTELIPSTNLAPLIASAESQIAVNLQAMRASGLYILAEQERAFEREFAAFCGAQESVGVGNGTAAIELCLREASIVKPHQEVVVPALTSLFTAQAVLAAGASLRFADVDSDSLLLSADKAEQACSASTAAILPVHLYGNPCNLDELAMLGKLLIQDACQAHGATWSGKPFSTWSPYVAYSFYPTKNLFCLGDGGAIVTPDRRVARRLRMLRDGGRKNDQVSRAAGINSRLDEMHACYLRAFLPKLEEWNQSRRSRVVLYDGLLAGCEGIRSVSRSKESVSHLYVVRAQHRDELRAFLLANGIQTGIHYPVPLHKQPAFRQFHRRGERFPNTELACDEILSLPLWPYMPDDSIERVAGVVRSFYRR